MLTASDRLVATSQCPVSRFRRATKRSSRSRGDAPHVFSLPFAQRTRARRCGICAGDAPARRKGMAKADAPDPDAGPARERPWPSFVTGLKRLAKDKDYVVDLLGQLEHSYKTRKGYWKGGTVGVFGYGGGVIPALHRGQGRGQQAAVPGRRRVPHAAGDAAGRHALQHRRPAQDGRHLGEARLRADRVPRPVRRHHVPGRDHRERAARVRRDQRAGLRPGRRRPGGAHRRCPASAPRAASSPATTRPARTAPSSTASSTTSTGRRCRTSSSSSSPAARTTA